MNPRLRTATWLFLASVGFQLGFIFLDAFLSDEGVVLVAAEDLARGRLLYRDFYTPVTPAVYLVQGIAFKLLGVSFALSRTLMCITYAASVVCVFQIASHQLPKRAAIAVGLLAIPLQVWMWPHAHYFSYNALAIFFCLVALERACALEVTAPRSRAALGLGIALGAALWSKPNLALATGVGVFVHWLLAWGRTAASLPQTRARDAMDVARDGMRVSIGVAAISSPLLLYLLMTGTLTQMLESMLALTRVYGDVPEGLFPKLFPLTGQIDAVRIHPDLVVPGMLGNVFAHSRAYQELIDFSSWMDGLVRTIYYAPIALFLVSGFVLARAQQTRRWSQPHEVALLTFCACVMLHATLIPHPALHYLTPTLLPALALAGFILLAAIRGRGLRLRRFALATAGLLATVYVVASLAVLFAYANLPRDPVHTTRGTLWVEPGTARAWNAIVDFAEADIGAEERVFSAAHFPMFYFLTGRPHVTPYTDLRPGSPGAVAEARIIDQLDDDGVEWVLRLLGSQFKRLERFELAYPRLALYIDQEYEVVRRIEDRYGAYAEFLRRRTH